jgi:hypothetical protein
MLQKLCRIFKQKFIKIIEIWMKVERKTKKQRKQLEMYEYK